MARIHLSRSVADHYLQSIWNKRKIREGVKLMVLIQYSTWEKLQMIGSGQQEQTKGEKWDVLRRKIKVKIRFAAHKFWQNLREINQPLSTCFADHRKTLTLLDISK